MSRVFVQVNDEVIELSGEEAAERLAHCERLIARGEELMNSIERRKEATASAKAKLAALGLTDDEINALLGG